MEMSVCDHRDTSVDFRSWWQSACIKSYVACGCVLSSLESFHGKKAARKLTFSLAAKERTPSSFQIVVIDTLQPHRQKNFLFHFRDKNMQHWLLPHHSCAVFSSLRGQLLYYKSKSADETFIKSHE